MSYASSPRRISSSVRNVLGRDDLHRGIDDCDAIALDAPHDRRPGGRRAPRRGTGRRRASGTSWRSSGERTVSPMIRTSVIEVDPTLRAGRVAARGAEPSSTCERGSRRSPTSSRAAGVLGWDQRVTMPPLGTEARAESLATLGRIIHERFTRRRDRPPARPARAARGVAAVRLRRREPDPRHAPRLGEGAPRADRAPRRDDARSRPRPPRLGRGARARRLRLLPPRTCGRTSS